jgi:hypothetical protein
MSGLKKGDPVRKVIPDIVGKIVGAKVDDECKLVFEVEYKDAEGQVQRRFFPEKELTPEPSEETEKV